MHHLLVLLATSPAPGATPVPVDFGRLVENGKLMVFQVGATIFAIGLVMVGVEGMLKKSVLRIVGGFGLAIPCGLFVLDSNLILGIIQGIGAGLKGA